MEDIHILNFDCISCFEITDFKSYFQILLANSIIFKKIYLTSILSDIRGFKNLCCFRNLTNITFHSRLLEKNDISKYIYSYHAKYNIYPSLKCMTIYQRFIPIGWETLDLSEITKLTNLSKYDYVKGSLSIAALNQLSKLTYLAFTMHESDFINQYKQVSNLRVLRFHWKDDIFPSLTYSSDYKNLHTLKIRCDTKYSSTFAINVSTLTSLSLYEQGDKKYGTSINLHNLINLKYLKLRHIIARKCNEFFSVAIHLRTIIMQNSSKSFGQHVVIQNMINLEHLEIESMDSVELKVSKNMTRLNIVKIKH